MPLINTSIPNLIQGVSQQPDAIKFDGQCNEQENALSSVVDGLTKRPNTRHVALLLQSAIDANSFIHFIDRSPDEKYVLIHNGTKLYAWNTLTGVEATINGSTGGFTCSGSYLDSSDPLSDIKALTVADNTFLLNTETVVQEDVSTLSAAVSEQALATVTQGDYGKLYKIIAERTLPPAEISVNTTTSGTQFLHTFSITDGGVGYGINQDGTDNSTPDNIKIYPKGFSADHPNAIEGVIDPPDSGNPTAGQIISLSVSTLLLDEEITEWVAERPVYVENLGALGTTSASDPSIASNADSAKIAERITDQASYNTADISNAEAQAFLDNFTWTQYGSSILIEIDPRDFLTGNSVNYFNTVRSSSASLVQSATYDNAEVIFRTEDGLSGNGIAVAYKTVEAISDLPLENQHGFKVKVTGDADLEQDDYYVRFEAEGGVGFGQGSYVETSGSEITQQLDSTTFPSRLISTGVNTFSLKGIETNIRDAGDDDTNPLPSFVNKKISNIFFYKNRLGLLSVDNVIFSEAGSFFNFFRTSVRSLLDSDPIDVAVSSSNVTTLSSAIGFQENLVIFSTSGQQFVLKGSELLTAKTVSITPITNFNNDTRVEPIPVGSYIYFPFTRGNFSGLREFTVNATSDTYDASEVTDHVPSYIPSNITQMDGTSSEDILVLVSSNDPSSIYVYKYFWNGNQKVLSSWSKFSITGDIRGLQFAGSTLYLVVTHNSETQLLEMPLESGLKDDAGYNTYLDQRIEDTVLAGGSTITLPFTPLDDTIEVYTKDGLKLNATNVGSTVTLSQSVSEDTDVWVGYPYTMKYTFSEQLFKAGQSKTPSAAAKLMVRNGSLFFNNTSYFQVKVTPKARDTYVNTFTPDVVGSTTLGDLQLDDGFYRFPVFTKAEDTQITIENNSALPSNFTSAEFESFTHSRSNRYG